MKNKVTATTAGYIVGVIQPDGSISAQIVPDKKTAEMLKRRLSSGKDGIPWIASSGIVPLETNEPCPCCDAEG